MTTSPSATGTDQALASNLTRTRSGRIEAALLLAVAAILCALTLLRHRQFFHDDEFISLRYAANLVNHGELAWNLGERVQGYTNFLHLLATAGLLKLGFSGMAAARLVNAAGAFALLGFTARASRQVTLPGRPLWIGVLPVALVLTTIPVVIWTLGGLEAVCVAAGLAALTAILLPGFVSGAPSLRRCALAGVVAALSFMIRPDAIVFSAVSGFALLLLTGGTRRARFLRLIAYAAAAASLLVIYELWVWSYYGDLLPNTFRAKTGTPLDLRLAVGGAYLWRSLLMFPSIVVGVPLGLWLLARRQADAVTAFLLAGVLCHLAYVWVLGGDHMLAGRFLVPIAGPAALLVGAGAAQFAPKTSSLWIGMMLASVTAFLIYPPLKLDKAAAVGRVVGQHVATAWPAGDLVAVHTAGSTPFFAQDLRFVDMLGLNDRAIAARQNFPIITPQQRWPGHARGDGAYVLRRQPDFIIAGPAMGTSVDKPWFLSDVELARLPEFARCYQLMRETLPAFEGSETGAPEPFLYYRRTCPKG